MENDSKSQEMMQDELHVTCTSTVAHMCQPLNHSYDHGSYFGQTDIQYIFYLCTNGADFTRDSNPTQNLLERGREG